MKYKYTKEVMEYTAKISKSFRDLTINLGITPHGGSISHVKKMTIKHEIDTSHFSRIPWNKGTVSNKKHSPEQILSVGKEEKSYKLKRALLELGTEYKCAVCSILEWHGQELPLQIDHINGIKTNNSRENLRFICPNCHSLTETFCAKNIALKKKLNN